MDFISTYVVQVLDIIFILGFFILIFNNLPLQRMVGAFKGLIIITILWFLARLFNFSMAETILSQIVQYGFLGLIILFPLEFKKLLENVGRKRMFNWNINSLISLDGRREVAKAVVNMARNKEGGIIVIAKGDNLDEEIDSGNYIGEMAVDHKFIEMIFNKDSKVREGAMVIKDNEIVSTNCRLPMANNIDLTNSGAGARHLAGFGVVYMQDCVSIVVSQSQATISIFGYINGTLSSDFSQPLKEFDPVNGVTEDDIVTLIEKYLKDSGKRTVKKQKPVAKPKPQREPKERKQKEKKPVKK